MGVRFIKAMIRKYTPVRDPDGRIRFAGRNPGIQVVSERLSLCRDCEFREGERCGVCGCFVQLKAKVGTEKCPHDDPRWKRSNVGDQPLFGGR